MKSTHVVRPNPGGEIAPDEVLGRDDVINALWRILESQSVVLSAERRMGKTCILKKMRAEPPAGVVAIFQDLEGLSTPADLAEKVANDLSSHVSMSQGLGTTVRGAFKSFGGLEIGGVLKLPPGQAIAWRELLTATIRSATTADRRLVLMWDELPLFVHKVMRGSGSREAMGLLDVLRSLRQEIHGVRFVFTGSRALPPILHELRRDGYVNEPVNDMYKVDLPPLELDAATELARRCLRADPRVGASVDELARVLATEVEGHPYYVHHVARSSEAGPKAPTVDTIRQIVGAALTAPGDPWDFGHYRTRITEYYPGQEAEALAVLDGVAQATGSLPRAAVLEAVTARMPVREPETIRSLTQRLMDDHYLTRLADGSVRFRSTLLERWWRLDRGLEP